MYFVHIRLSNLQDPFSMLSSSLLAAWTGVAYQDQPQYLTRWLLSVGSRDLAESTLFCSF